MEDIGRSEGQGILVEGCPGIGKTMFSWDLPSVGRGKDAAR